MPDPQLLIAVNQPAVVASVGDVIKDVGGTIFLIRRIKMKQDARKNLNRRKRQKRRLALKKYTAVKKSKGTAA